MMRVKHLLLVATFLLTGLLSASIMSNVPSTTAGSSTLCTEMAFSVYTIERKVN